jgi:hypothetical protein
VQGLVNLGDLADKQTSGLVGQLVERHVGATRLLERNTERQAQSEQGNLRTRVASDLASTAFCGPVLGLRRVGGGVPKSGATAPGRALAIPTRRKASRSARRRTHAVLVSHSLGGNLQETVPASHRRQAATSEIDDPRSTAPHFPTPGWPQR